jgi:predicted TIM-barrel fold metal-dependent hydrolase
MDRVIQWASGSPAIYPFYWIDPSRPDACELVDMAVEKGIYGFKVIRSEAKPVDEKTIPVYRRMAHHGKPVTFHSGILWDGRASSDNFRPANWEGLLAVPGLRFALAHISWPWCDECIAVYGKFLNAITRNGWRNVPEMFIDTTPGTPKIYRKEALSKIYTVGYDVLDHVMFGTDCRVSNYNVKWASDWLATDDGIYDELALDGRSRDSAYRSSLERYLFGGDNSNRKAPTADGLPRPKL